MKDREYILRIVQSMIREGWRPDLSGRSIEPNKQEWRLAWTKEPERIRTISTRR